MQADPPSHDDGIDFDQIAEFDDGPLFEGDPFESPDNGIADDMDCLSSSERESQVCDHAPEYKETSTISTSAGASIGGIGASSGRGEPVIVCTKCEKAYPVEIESDPTERDLF